MTQGITGVSVFREAADSHCRAISHRCWCSPARHHLLGLGVWILKPHALPSAAFAFFSKTAKRDPIVVPETKN